MSKKTAKQTTNAQEPAQTSTAVTVAGQNFGGAVMPAGVTVKRHITLPSLAIKLTGQAEILTIMDPLRISKIKQKKEFDTAGKEKPAREPATICTAGRHFGEHNEKAVQGVYTFIVPAVVKENLERDYPTDANGVIGYVGKSFYIRNLGKRTESQRYNDFEIFEVDVPAAGAAAA